MIQARHLYKSYSNLTVLHDVSVTIQAAELVAIVGPSGAGKSTLLHLLGTLDHADKGSIAILNTDVAKLSEKKLAQFRNRHIGFVFQFHHLLPEFTAVENICMPALIGGQKESIAQKRAMELLDFLKLSHRAQHKPNALSGGEQQRVAVARALINQPALVLADEPSGNLDSENARDLHTLFFDLCKNMGQTFVIVTHNPDLAAMAHRTLHMKDGQMV
ncbi:MAG: ABC transporter ATP-binding protein [Sphingobacteriales bacterium]|nr:ABC transporter ATP-binding protein [Sphingobacteriales bacterium]